MAYTKVIKYKDYHITVITTCCIIKYVFRYECKKFKQSPYTFKLNLERIRL